MNVAASFADDYRSARATFREQARKAGANLSALQHPEVGPDGDRLFTDIAFLGAAAARRAIVLISGTHGVEGFCGSGAQVDLLRRGELETLPEGLAVLIIHAINPYGFAWLRRVTHENVDLNRNWVDFSEPLPSNPGYDLLHEAIVPSQWSASALAKAQAVLDDYGAEAGMAALNQAMSGGQYRHPQGIFYGGAQPTWSRQTQANIFVRYLQNAREIAILDYHSGLGPRGFCELITTSASDSAAFARATRWYGPGVKSTVTGTSVAARIGGDGMSAASRLLPHAKVTAIALEFGTIPRHEARLALRADAWLHAYGDPLSPQSAEIKRQIRAAYYCDADDWKAMVAGQSLSIWRQAVAAMTGT